MYDVFEELLKKFNVTAYQVAKATGIPQTTFSTWKHRRNIISGEKAKKIADYFGVSVDYLMTGREDTLERAGTYYQEDITIAAEKMYHNSDLRDLFEIIQDSDPEDIKALRYMALALKRKDQKNQAGQGPRETSDIQS